ncbi:MAG: hypothetical protein LVQ95_03590 [Candidatus Micrarchaeales archaeon]|nr:hypothetical protein [Candidatus Micrarchaeales archaeon]
MVTDSPARRIIDSALEPTGTAVPPAPEQVLRKGTPESPGTTLLPLDLAVLKKLASHPEGYEIDLRFVSINSVHILYPEMKRCVERLLVFDYVSIRVRNSFGGILWPGKLSITEIGRRFIAPILEEERSAQKEKQDRKNAERLKRESEAAQKKAEPKEVSALGYAILEKLSKQADGITLARFQEDFSKSNGLRYDDVHEVVMQLADKELIELPGRRQPQPLTPGIYRKPVMIGISAGGREQLEKRRREL